MVRNTTQSEDHFTERKARTIKKPTKEDGSNQEYINVQSMQDVSQMTAK